MFGSLRKKEVKIEITMQISGKDGKSFQMSVLDVRSEMVNTPFLSIPVT